MPFYHAGGSGSIPRRIDTQGLKIIEEKVCLCSNIGKWLGSRVFSDKDVKP